MIVVSDLARSIAFYGAALDATVQVRLPHYALLDVGQAQLHLATSGPAPADRPQVGLAPPRGDLRPGLLVIDVADCRSAADSMVILGARLLSQPTVPPWGGERRCFVLDPDGHLLELNEALPGGAAT